MTGVTRACLLAMLFVTALAHAQTLPECQSHQFHGRSAEAKSCFTRLTGSPRAYLRAEGFMMFSTATYVVQFP